MLTSKGMPPIGPMPMKGGKLPPMGGKSDMPPMDLPKKRKKAAPKKGSGKK